MKKLFLILLFLIVQDSFAQPMWTGKRVKTDSLFSFSNSRIMGNNDTLRLYWWKGNPVDTTYVDAVSRLVCSYPLTLATSGKSNFLGLGYNTTNLKLTANQLNTIQDITTASNVTFGSVGSSTYHFSLNDGYIGSDESYALNLYDADETKVFSVAQGSGDVVGGKLNGYTVRQGASFSDTTQIPRLNLANTFTLGQTITNTGLSANLLTLKNKDGVVRNNADSLGKFTASYFLFNGEDSVRTNYNKYQAIIGTSTGSIFKKQTYYWDGDSYEVTIGYGIGDSALYSNTGTQSNGFGGYALQNNTGTQSNGFGYAALYYNTGTYSNGFGASALYSNTGTQSNGFGYAALRNNTGTQSNGFGYAALYYNTGTYSNGFGGYALRNNTGTQSNGFGHAALQNNTGTQSNGFGHTALQNNTGTHSNGFGASALYSNNWSNVIGIGYQTTNYFLADVTTSKSFTDAEVNGTLHKIAIPSHGFGTVGNKINLKFAKTVGTTSPTGLVNGTVYQFTITTADTLYLVGITDAGSADFEGTLTNSVDIHNSIAIGTDVNASKSHQTVIGDITNTETLLFGEVITNGRILGTGSVRSTDTLRAGNWTVYSYVIPSGDLVKSSSSKIKNIDSVFNPDLSKFKDVKPYHFRFKKSAFLETFDNNSIPDSIEVRVDSITTKKVSNKEYKDKARVDFYFRNNIEAEKRSKIKYTGLMAEDVGALTGKPNTDKLDNAEVTAVMWLMIQRLESELDSLKAEIKLKK